MSSPSPRRGVSAVEVIVVAGVLAMLVLVLLMTLPRRREVARRASCQQNLAQIGRALVLYEQAAGHLPVVPELGSDPGARGSSPLKALLETLSLPDFIEVDDLKKPPAKRAGLTFEERPVRGFVCSSDPNATAGLFPAPVSYRANAGDRPDGGDGAFAPGRRLRIADVEAGDGASYTASFSERLVGNNQPASALENYAEASAPLPQGGCPQPPRSAWRGDAGSSWVAADWRSTLYNHSLTPNASPSCIAGDARAAYMGASSGHLGGVNVLIFDGSVRAFGPSVDPKIWRDLATPNAPATAPGAPR